jgi:hypothetical protein
MWLTRPKRSCLTIARDDGTRRSMLERTGTQRLPLASVFQLLLSAAMRRGGLDGLRGEIAAPAKAFCLLAEQTPAKVGG